MASFATSRKRSPKSATSSPSCRRIMPHDASAFMSLALQEARAALSENEVPIGCVIVHDPASQVIARAHNRRHNDNDPTAHAELLAIRQAARALNNWRLLDCTLYVTLEPCPMCAGAIVLARIPRLVYGAPDPKKGAVDSVYDVLRHPANNHRVDIG